MLRPGSLLGRTLALVLLLGLVLAAYQLVVAPVLAAYRAAELGIEVRPATASYLCRWRFLRRWLELAHYTPRWR